ncbi:hypothetical protein B296_00003229 [Ensete ventricosum]|uniref:UDP-glucose 4-epimerase n=1 Tax=Ensete ventricosum TaxID=4639 RepID=A0A427B828_ENSVE|nr:hypothetical protein B296_00003229 [Ensete ventricosum]
MLCFLQIDIRDREALETVFASTKFDAVIHFAGLKAVGESVHKPLLYYKNNIVVGAHPSGHIGEDPRGIPNNLMPLVQQVAVGRRPALTVDYIHVVDLADGHIAALRKLFDDPSVGILCFSFQKIPLIIAGRRPGDAEILYASTAKAEKELNWKAKYGIEEMCHDQWNWASKNPWGYGSPDPAN